MLWQNYILTPLIPKYLLSKSTMFSELALPRTPRPMTVHLPLPPEIRNLIYTYVLTENTEASKWIKSSIASNENEHIDVWRPSTSCLSLLLVSRQTFLEAYPIYYRVNIFCFANFNILHRFLKNIGLARRQHVTRICFCWKGIDAKKTCRLLMMCPRLESLSIVLYNDEVPSRWIDLSKVTECAFLREVRGLETVKFIVTPPKRPGFMVQYPPETAAELEELCDAMRRARLDRFKATSEDEINALKLKREIYRG